MVGTSSGRPTSFFLPPHLRAPRMRLVPHSMARGNRNCGRSQLSLKERRKEPVSPVEFSVYFALGFARGFFSGASGPAVSGGYAGRFPRYIRDTFYKAAAWPPAQQVRAIEETTFIFFSSVRRRSCFAKGATPRKTSHREYKRRKLEEE